MNPTRTFLFVLALSFVMFGGCATPASYTSEPMERYDNNTFYHVEQHTDGFTLVINYSRYQFIPESDAVALAGKSALLAIAHEMAQASGKKLQQINEQTIKMSMGRNGLSGITSWSGTVRVFYSPNK